MKYGNIWKVKNSENIIPKDANNGAYTLLNFFKKEKSTKKTPNLKFVMNEYNKKRINAIGTGNPPNTTKR